MELYSNLVKSICKIQTNQFIGRFLDCLKLVVLNKLL